MADEIHVQTSIGGHMIPMVRRASRDYPLHSRIDPVKEAMRLHDSSRRDGFIVVLGLGFGYHILPFLHDSYVSKLVVIERDDETVGALGKYRDFSDILSDGRVMLIAGATPEEVESCIASTYLPAVHGAFSIVALRARCDLDHEYFESVTAAINRALVAVRADISVQSFFGKTWFSNGIRNLESAATSARRREPERRTDFIVTAAGPSLEKHVETIRKRSGRTGLIAVDTSLPFLLSAGLEPDYVVSIDCQHVSYAHFMKRIPERTVLAVDIFSSPVVTRRSVNRLFFLNSHPFSRIVSAACPGLPQVDTSGGNVTWSALSLALALGAETMTLYGADYSYPDGKSYAKGTYIYDIFRTRESRTAPVECGFFGFLYRADGTRCEKLETGNVYRTEILDRYREALVHGAERLGCMISVPERLGEPYRFQRLPGRSFRRPEPVTGTDSETILQAYARSLKSIPDPSVPMSLWLASLPPDLGAAALSILPVAASVSRVLDCPPQELPVTAFIEARDRCVSWLGGYLDSRRYTMPAYPTKESD